jgi:hypothetical protein
MIIHDEDRDIIRIDLEEVFGKVIELSANDADRLNAGDGVKILVLSPTDGAIYQSLVDMVVMDITGRLADKLYEEGIDIKMPNLNVNIKKDSINKDGLKIIQEAVQVALTTGVLSYFQQGMPGYSEVQQANRFKYMHALNTMAAAQAFRMDSYQRPRITQRDIN